MPTKYWTRRICGSLPMTLDDRPMPLICFGQDQARHEPEGPVAAANPHPNALRPRPSWLGSHLGPAIGTSHAGPHFHSVTTQDPISGLCRPAERTDVGKMGSAPESLGLRFLTPRDRVGSTLDSGRILAGIMIYFPIVFLATIDQMDTISRV